MGREQGLDVFCTDISADGPGRLRSRRKPGRRQPCPRAHTQVRVHTHMHTRTGTRTRPPKPQVRGCCQRPSGALYPPLIILPNPQALISRGVGDGPGTAGVRGDAGSSVPSGLSGEDTCRLPSCAGGERRWSLANT